MEQLKHECGVAMIRLPEPLDAKLSVGSGKMKIFSFSS